MIRSLLVGTALLGGGGYYLSTNRVSADVVRTVNAAPHDTWRGFDTLFRTYADGITEIGTGETPGGWGKKPSEIKSSYTSVDGKEADFRISKGNAQAIRIHVRFEPIEDGRKTRMLMDTEVSNLPDDLKFGPREAQMFRATMNTLADQLVTQIESGKTVQLFESIAELRRRAAADPRANDYKLAAEEARRRSAQAAAARPMLNPDAARLNPTGTAPIPDSQRY
jgi:hypothetical protein